MAVVVPMIASFVAVSGGVAAAAVATTTLATFAAYATVAGGILTAVGALTGKKDLMKVGGILALGGAVTTAFSGSAAAAAPGAAGAAGAPAAPAAGTVSETVGTNAGLGEVVDATGGLETAVPGFSWADRAAQAAAAVPSAGAGTSIPGTVAPTAGEAAAGVYPDYGLSTTGVKLGPSNVASAGVPESLAKAAQGLNMGDLQTWWEKAKAAGSWLAEHPAVLKAGGDVLSSVYGPQAEQLDYQKSLMDRARANLNNPVRLLAGAKP